MQTAPAVLSKETSGSNLIIPSYHHIRLKHCRLEFTATQLLYRHLDDIEGQRREEALLHCRTRAWFVRNREDGSIRVASNACRLRWCPICAESRQNYIRHQVQEWFQTARHPKFLTLTIKHSQQDLISQIDKIYDCWRKMRKNPFFSKNCTGGIWFFQICRNSQRAEWHPHIHAIITGNYMNYRLLREIWLEYTGDSHIVDIKVIRDPKIIGEYVARYAARPLKLAGIPFKEGIEAMTALYGRRIAGSWGTGRGITFRPKKIPDPQNWEYMGGWTTIHAISTYDERAKAIVEAYHQNQPLGEGYSCYDIESFIDGVGVIPASDLEIDNKSPPWLF